MFMLLDIADPVSLCNRLGFLSGTFSWSQDDLAAAGWTDDLIQRVQSIADAMEQAAAEVITLSSD